MAHTIKANQLNPRTPVFTKIKYQTTREDIHEADCGLPAKCMGAVCINREHELGGRGYIRFEANEVAFTKDDYRYLSRPFRNALEMLRDLDELGERVGETEARNLMDAREFTLELISVTKIPAKASRARKDQINRARQAREAQRRAIGLPAQEPRKRYSGVRLHSHL
jgi:hypothetical protein